MKKFRTVAAVVIMFFAAMAAYLAGLAVGYWKNREEIIKNWEVEQSFEPVLEKEERDKKMKGWERAVTCSYGWAKEDDENE